MLRGQGLSLRAIGERVAVSEASVRRALSDTATDDPTTASDETETEPEPEAEPETKTQSESEAEKDCSAAVSDEPAVPVPVWLIRSSGRWRRSG